jgi:membrane protein implicated in regulation of membrane protease activity
MRSIVIWIAVAAIIYSLILNYFREEFGLNFIVYVVLLGVLVGLTALILEKLGLNKKKNARPKDWS